MKIKNKGAAAQGPCFAAVLHGGDCTLKAKETISSLRNIFKTLGAKLDSNRHFARERFSLRYNPERTSTGGQVLRGLLAWKASPEIERLPLLVNEERLELRNFSMGSTAVGEEDMADRSNPYSIDHAGFD